MESALKKMKSSDQWLQNFGGKENLNPRLKFIHYIDTHFGTDEIIISPAKIESLFFLNIE